MIFIFIIEILRWMSGRGRRVGDLETSVTIGASVMEDLLATLVRLRKIAGSRFGAIENFDRDSILLRWIEILE